MSWFREKRRAHVRARSRPAGWERILERNVPLWRHLSPEDQAELVGHMHVFLSEKRFEGAGGLTVDEEIRVTVAAQACVLLLHRKTAYYPGLVTIIVYPGAYVVSREHRDGAGIVSEAAEARLGESWTRGVVVLAWDAVQGTATDASDCRNVVLHEFAHQLDAETGLVEGSPRLPERSMYVSWARVLGREYIRLRQDAAMGRATVLDRYGATNPAEFFAVATECFFTRAQALQARHPELYAELAGYYQQDPASFP